MDGGEQVEGWSSTPTLFSLLGSMDHHFLNFIIEASASYSHTEEGRVVNNLLSYRGWGVERVAYFIYHLFVLQH